VHILPPIPLKNAKWMGHGSRKNHVAWMGHRSRRSHVVWMGRPVSSRGGAETPVRECFKAVRIRREVEFFRSRFGPRFGLVSAAAIQI